MRDTLAERSPLACGAFWRARTDLEGQDTNGVLPCLERLARIHLVHMAARENLERELGVSFDSPIRLLQAVESPNRKGYVHPEGTPVGLVMCSEGHWLIEIGMHPKLGGPPYDVLEVETSVVFTDTPAEGPRGV